MGFSYLRSKLPIFISCQTLCSNKIVSHDHGFLQKVINGGFKLQSPRTYKSNTNLIKYASKVRVFCSVMCFSAAKHTNPRLLLAAGRKFHIPLPWRRWFVTNADQCLLELYRLPWRQWIRNPRFVLIGSCVLFAIIFGRFERIPYSRRHHFVLSCNMLERKIGDIMMKKEEKDHEKSILPPSSAKSIRVQSILGEIVQAMHSGLRLEKNCSVSVHVTKNPKMVKDMDKDLARFGQRQHASSTPISGKKEVIVEKLGNQNGVKRRRNLGLRFATKHLDGLNWEVMVVKDSYVKNAIYIPNGRVVIFTGLLDRLKSDAEVATVLAHEVGHGIARHQSEHLMRMVWMVVLLLLILPPLHPQHTQKFFEIFFSFFSRRKELEADYIGLMLMASAGYDPRVAPEVYEVQLGGGSGGLSSSHPPGSKRAQKLNKPRVMQKAVAIYEDVVSGHGVTSFI